MLHNKVTPITHVRDDLPPTLVELVGRSLAASPEGRPSSAADFADELFAVLHRAQRRYLKTRLGERVRASVSE